MALLAERFDCAGWRSGNIQLERIVAFAQPEKTAQRLVDIPRVLPDDEKASEFLLVTQQ
jgi:hypothetical protein